MTTIHLPCYGITIQLEHLHNQKSPGVGTIASDLRNLAKPSGVISGIESLILAHACAGVDVENPAYIEGIEMAVESMVLN